MKISREYLYVYSIGFWPVASATLIRTKIFHMFAGAKGV